MWKGSLWTRNKNITEKICAKIDIYRKQTQWKYRRLMQCFTLETLDSNILQSLSWRILLLNFTIPLIIVIFMLSIQIRYIYHIFSEIIINLLLWNLCYCNEITNLFSFFFWKNNCSIFLYIISFLHYISFSYVSSLV